MMHQSFDILYYLQYCITLAIDKNSQAWSSPYNFRKNMWNIMKSVDLRNSETHSPAQGTDVCYSGANL